MATSVSSKVFATTAAAALVGAASAGVGAYYVEANTKLPPFSLTAERFDTSTFFGRYAKMISNGDPFTLFYTKQQVTHFQNTLNTYKHDKAKQVPLTDTTNAQLWKARKVVEACVHPDTGEVIPRPFRMSGYVPFNGPVCAAMMLTTSTPLLLFWNWVNQSQNALVNYFNRNASSKTDNTTLAISYSAAVGSAITVAFGLAQTLKRMNKGHLLKFVAFPASMIASCLNCYIMRRPETLAGIDLLTLNKSTSEYNKVGTDSVKSKEAAKKAVQETVMSRALLQLPVFFGPPLVLSLPYFVNLMARLPAINVPLMTLVTMVSFGFGLPATVAVFPQFGEINMKDLEKEVQSKLKAMNSTSEVFYYSKGL